MSDAVVGLAINVGIWLVAYIVVRVSNERDRRWHP